MEKSTFSSVMDKRMEINILDYRLKVTSIKKQPSVIAKFTHALINILFLRNARLRTAYRLVGLQVKI